MNLETTYLGLKLRNPLVVGASPICDSMDTCLRLEEAGASALVMHSLFEEQVILEQMALNRVIDETSDSYSEATSFFPHVDEFQLTTSNYLHTLERLKAALTIPVIASLNGRHPGTWISYAKQMESAGADAIELNPYNVATDPMVTGSFIETEVLEVLRAVTASVKIPVSVKLTPFHSSLPQFATTLDTSGAAGLVLFNRFYQPDFNIEDLEVTPQIKLSDSSELLMRLRWLAILSPLMKGSLAASGGVHTPADFIKAILAGANAVQVVSAVLKSGPGVVSELLQGLKNWMDEHEYDSVSQFTGALNLRRCPDPSAHERANYIRVLQSWRL